jgi:hypothetical protein
MRSVLLRSLLAAALVSGAVTGVAMAADDAKDKTTVKPTRACFLPRDVSGWKLAGNRDQLNLRVNQRDYYTAHVLGICSNINFAQSMALESYGSSFICEGDDAKLAVRDPTGPQRCNLQKFRKLTKDEVAGLSKDDKP